MDWFVMNNIHDSKLALFLPNLVCAQRESWSQESSVSIATSCVLDDPGIKVLTAGTARDFPHSYIVQMCYVLPSLLLHKGYWGM
jgi:hypothetical protein